MNTQVTMTYTGVIGPITGANALAKLKTIPLDSTLPQFWGLLPITDTPSNPGSTVARVIVLQMTPTIADATATANLVTSGNTGAVSSATVTDQGGLYARPPIVSFTGGNPLPVTIPGTGTVAPAAAQAIAQCQVRGCIALLGGTGYTGATTVTFSGPLAPGGVQATGTANIVGTAITGVTMVTAGGPYLQAPTVTIFDSGGGAGAEVVAGLGVSGIVVTYGGLGYQSAPTVVLTPLFKQQAPDTSNQAATMEGWMTGILQAAMNTQFQEVAAVS